MENLALRSSITQAKIIGTLVSISGASVVLFYRGPTIISPSQSPSLSLHSPRGTSETKWVIGGLLLAVENLLFSGCSIIQTQVMKIYPAEIVVVFLCALCVTIISAPVCLMAEGNLLAWTLRPDVALVTIIYSGFFGSSISVVIAWALHLKGPVYVSIFKPLSIVIAAAMGVIFLGDALYLGSLVGAIILSIGFYAVIWAKAKEGLRKDYCCDSLGSSSDEKTPLLNSYKFEVHITSSKQTVVQNPLLFSISSQLHDITLPIRAPCPQGEHNAAKGYARSPKWHLLQEYLANEP
uniref:WAT1-related protein n=1 Tax=Quercus lobata TaxID=97700 RepID=A0A7N2L0C3_QUELO